MDDEAFSFVAYRSGEGMIVVENTLSEPVGLNITTIMGRVIYVGELAPGMNEIPFDGRGVHMFRFFGSGVDHTLKAPL